MNIKDKHNISLPISEISLFESQVGITSSFYITEGIYLKNQTHKVATLLICMAGKLIFQDENGKNETLISGDLMNIKPMVKYSLRGLTESQLLVIK